MDIVGSAVYDTKPRFPIPAELASISKHPSSASPSLQSLIFRLRAQTSTALNDIALALEGASYISDVVKHQGKNPLFWNDGMNGTRLIGPLSYQLLSLPRVEESDLHLSTFLEARLREMTRLTLLVIIAKLKPRFTQNGDELEPLQQRFARIFLHNINNRDTFPELHLWAVSIVGSAIPGDPSRDLFIDRIREIAGCMNIKCGVAAFHIVRDIFLVDDLMARDVKPLLVESICDYHGCFCDNHDLP
jgi:hypothetical protein